MGGKKHPPHEEHENMERWLVSYADLVTLLFAFFVVMWAVGQTDPNKAETILHSISHAFNWEGKSSSASSQSMQGAFQVPTGKSLVILGGRPDGRPQPIQPEQKVKEETKKTPMQLVMDNLKKKLQMKLRKKQNKIIKIFETQDSVVLRIPSEDLFKAGSASINPRYFPILDDLFATMKNKGLYFRIEGHTDNSRPGKNSKFKSNIELSSARSVAVAHYILATKKSEEKGVTVMGYGSRKPIAPNNSKKNRDLNRRIEVRLFFRDVDMIRSEE